MVEHQIDARPRREGGELLEQSDGLEDEVRRAVVPLALQRDEDPPVGHEAERVLCNRGCRPLPDRGPAFTGPAEPVWRGFEHLLEHVNTEWESQPRHRDPIFARDR